MRVNYRVIYVAEKLANAMLNIIPDPALRRIKSLFSNSRKSFFSNTSNFFNGRIIKSVNNMDFVRKNSSFNPEEAVVLELGSGGHGVDLILLYLCGARQIHTVDIRFFGFLYMRQAIHDFREHLNTISKVLSVDSKKVKERYARIENLTEVEEMMQAMNIQFHSFQELKLNHFKPAEKIDFLFSESNLQRIPGQDIKVIFRNISAHLGRDSISFHRIDMGDINTQRTRPLHDPQMWKFHFLKYSDKAWSRRITSRLGSQNRLRQPEFLQMFTELGFVNIYAENYLVPEDLSRIKDFKLDQRFRKFSDRENVISHLRLISLYRPQNNRANLREEDLHLHTGSVMEIMPEWSPQRGLYKSA